MNGKFSCPRCGGTLRFTVSASIEYALNPRTGEIGKRKLSIHEGAYAEPGARCTSCGEMFEVFVDDGAVTEICS